MLRSLHFLCAEVDNSFDCNLQIKLSFIKQQLYDIKTGLALGAKEMGSFGPIKSINTNF